MTPEGVPIDLGGVALRYPSTGKPEISIDGMRGSCATATPSARDT